MEYLDYDLVLRSVVAWAEGKENVRRVVLTGSAATVTAHPLSDRDLEFHVRDTATLEGDDSWWDTLGNVLAVERLENGNDQPTRIVYYVGGKLDFTLVNIDDERGVYERPFKVLLDKDGDVSDFKVVEPSLAPPSQKAFDECMNWGYAAAIMTAKAIVRDEPWSVKVRDNDLKTELLRAIEWDHAIRYGSERDVRYLGTRMRQWMDADVQQRLGECWASFDLLDSREALQASIALFSDLASQIATAAGLIDFDHKATRSEIHGILAMRTGVRSDKAPQPEVR